MTVVLQLGRYSSDLMLYMIRFFVIMRQLFSIFQSVLIYSSTSIKQEAHTAATRIGASSLYDLLQLSRFTKVPLMIENFLPHFELLERAEVREAVRFISAPLFSRRCILRSLDSLDWPMGPE
jgi:hypothetical protein